MPTSQTPIQNIVKNLIKKHPKQLILLMSIWHMPCSILVRDPAEYFTGYLVGHGEKNDIKLYSINQGVYEANIKTI